MRRSGLDRPLQRRATWTRARSWRQRPRLEPRLYTPGEREEELGAKGRQSEDRLVAFESSALVARGEIVQRIGFAVLCSYDFPAACRLEREPNSQCRSFTGDTPSVGQSYRLYKCCRGCPWCSVGMGSRFNFLTARAVILHYIVSIFVVHWLCGVGEITILPTSCVTDRRALAIPATRRYVSQLPRS